MKNIKNRAILDKLTLEEKASLCTGKDFWHLMPIERLGIPSVTMTDGPHGLRMQSEGGEKRGLLESDPSTCFPTAVTTACSWDRDLLFKMGQAMGEECLKEKVGVILGPGVNMKRSPLCGRNFEYFSEDPLLAGELAAGLVKGIQSKGVGACLKHFAANSQEKRRMVIDSIVDERALREIYLTAFEIAVKKSQPWTVMNAYNKLNGTYCSDNDYLQNKILRDEWGFDGVVVSDWGAVNDRVAGLAGGNDLEMPTSGGYNTKKICDAVRDGSLSEDAVDIAADRMLTLINRASENMGDYEYDIDVHHNIAAEVCESSLVLLKNQENILPLSKEKTVAVIGEMARAPRYQGAGSSRINPTKISDAFEELMREGYKVSFAPGYFKKKDEINETMFKDAKLVASRADTVLLFIGLTEEYESEGFDRSHMNLPASHNKLLEEILTVNKNVVVVLSGGSPVAMPWISEVKAVVNGYLGGQASGKAVARVISGKINPSGKLAETYPLCLEDTPCYNYYPGMMNTAEHRESIYIGYRYYQKAKKDVLFPFGFGLSYTQFEYSDINISSKKIKDTDTLTVSCKVKNIGNRDGAETVQLYVSDCESTAFRPERELRDFAKIYLEKGETKAISFTLSKRAFAYYNTNINDWHVESGVFEILIGASSEDIRLSEKVNVTSTDTDAVIPDYREVAPCYYTADIQNVSDSEYEAVLGREIPPQMTSSGEKLTMSNSLGDAWHTRGGARIISLITKTSGKVFDPEDPNSAMIENMVLEIPIRNFVTMSQGVFTEKMAEGLLKIINDEGTAAGLAKILAGIIPALAKLPELIKSI